ncbi:IS4 family transposase [Streptomyces narbonensis]|uniref:IS4 family transposase n=1 Tax=Streptomyces narbonensis TaxID=67333 RepID=UPI0033F3EAFF
MVIHLKRQSRPAPTLRPPCRGPGAGGRGPGAGPGQCSCFWGAEDVARGCDGVEWGPAGADRHPDEGVHHRARARTRLGEDVLETVFRQVAGPLATPTTPGAWWRGLRLLALDGTQFDLPDSTSNGDTFDGPSTTGGVPFGFPQVRAVVLAEIGTHGVLDARLGGYRDGERSLAHPLAGSTGPGDLVIADRGFWSVEFAHVFPVAGADLLVRLQSNHLGTAQEELPGGSHLSIARPGKDVRLRAAREGRTLPKHVIYRVITFAKGDKVAYLGTTLLDPEQYPAAELVALYRERWEIELAFDEIKNHLGPGGPIRSRTPE